MPRSLQPLLVNTVRTLAPVLLLLPAPSFGRAAGLVSTECGACHKAGSHTPALKVAPASFSPGAQVTLTVAIPPGGAVGGLYLRATSGTFATLAGQNTKLSGNELTHDAPKPGTAAGVSFDVKWTAPSQAGAVTFEAFTVRGNADNSSGGDSSGLLTQSLVFGCSPATFCRDFDGDGVGATASGTQQNCSALTGWSAQCGDCDDTNALVKPGAVEACNGRDDNCNATADEGLTAVTTWPDGDGDGYGDAAGAGATGCPGGNRAPNKLDCNDLDAQVNPGVKEVCNFRDDDCDGSYDEGVFAKCGVGWCARTGSSCEASSCTPAAPLNERCNKIDDDCNGKVDDGTPCAAGESCIVGVCVNENPPPPDAGPVDAGVVGDAGVGIDAGHPATAKDAGVEMNGAGQPPAPQRGCAAAPGLLSLCCALLGYWLSPRSRRATS